LEFELSIINPLSVRGNDIMIWISKLFRRFSLSLLTMFLAKCLAAESNPHTLGSRPEMFVETSLIDQKTNVSLQLATPIRREVVLTTDQPWEGPHSAYFTAFQDGDRVRLYYRGFVPKDNSDQQVTCYAESPDGIHFTRPALGLFDFNGSTSNNIVYRGTASHNFAPFLDKNPAAKPAAKYKALGGLAGHLFAFASPDGIHWTKMSEEPALTKGAFDSLNIAFWDTLKKEYHAYSRCWTSGDFKGHRDIQSNRSKDFLHWDEPEHNQYHVQEGAKVPTEDFYTSATLPCPGAEQIYLAFPKRFVPSRKKFPDYHEMGVSDAIFMSSRDGINWDRSFLEAWVRPGLDPHNWTQRSNMPAWGILETDPGEFSTYISEHYGWPDNRLRRLTVRRHGFASVHAGAAGGEFTTVPLQFTGINLLINYATSAAGSIRIEVQDTDGKAIPGFTLPDMPPLFGDELDAGINWKTKSDIASLIAKSVRLRFVMRDADLFSVRVN
jgi:hypothetical protein